MHLCTSCNRRTINGLSDDDDDDDDIVYVVFVNFNLTNVCYTDLSQGVAVSGLTTVH